MEGPQMKKLILFTISFIISLSVLAQWERQYPQPTENDLHDAFFVNDNTGWAVGENGTIIHTNDGGIAWEHQSSGTALTLRSVCFTDPLTGWIVGGSYADESIVLKTIDGGVHWCIQFSDTTTCLRSICFVNPENGWIAGDHGVVFHTIDGGNNWTIQACGSGGTFLDLYEIHFTDLINGWIATNYGFYCTTDGGLNWYQKLAGDCESVFFINQNEGWVSTSGFEYETGKLMHSVDAFNTWDTLRQCGGGEGTSCGSNSIFFKDSNNGWMLSWDCFMGWGIVCLGNLLKTQDGGETWESISIPTGGLSMNNLSFTPEGKGCIVGNHGLIITTTQWSDQWVRNSHGNDACLFSLSFPDNLNGWAVGSAAYSNSGFGGGSTIIHTTDGGQIWNEQFSGIQVVWKSICFVNSDDGWAVGSDYPALNNLGGCIIYSPNGGADWSIQNTDLNHFYNDVFFLDEYNGWTVGYYYEYPDSEGILLSTSDGGAIWQQQALAFNNQLNAVHFPDLVHGWVVGQQGAIYNTMDGGINWHEQQSYTDMNLVSVHFTDTLNGWVVGRNLYSDGIILHTTDGGNTWQEVDSIDNSFSSIYFRDVDNGLIAGSGGTILVTNNGGDTWQLQESGTGEDLNAVYMTENGNGYAAGKWGTVLHSSSLVVSTEKPKNQNLNFKIQVYPNPSCGISDIRYRVPVGSPQSAVRSKVTLSIYDIHGQKVSTLVNENQPAGEYSVRFDGSDLPAGVYIISLQAGDLIQTKKMLMINDKR